MSQEDLQVIASFESSIEAEIVRGRLAANDIYSVLQDSNTVNINWGLSNAVGGVKLAVRTGDVAQARNLLNQRSEVGFSDGGWGACPACGSKELDLFVDRRWSNWGWLLLGIPFLFPKNKLRCRTCGAVSLAP